MKRLIVALLFLLFALPAFPFGGAGWSDADPFFNKGGLTCYMLEQSVADDTGIALPTGVAGFGQVMAGDNDEWIQVRFTSAGVVTSISASTNGVATDTDAKLCVYDAGSGIAVKNRLGSTKTIRFIFYYSKQ